MNLSEHKIFISGGTRGIGFQLAKRLVACGSTVAVCGRTMDSLNAAREELPTITALQCDLADISTVA